MYHITVKAELLVLELVLSGLSGLPRRTTGRIYAADGQDTVRIDVNFGCGSALQLGQRVPAGHQMNPLVG